MSDSADKSADPAEGHRSIRERLEALSQWVRDETPPDDVTMFVDTAANDGRLLPPVAENNIMRRQDHDSRDC